MKPILLLALTLFCSTAALPTIAGSNSDLNAQGLISLKSDFTVKQSADRFAMILKKKGLTLFTRIDHSSNAANIKQHLDPTEVIIFGNPNIGTLLMQCSKTIAIDLPLKALFWQDTQGQVWLSYNDPTYLKNRHQIKGCDKPLSKVANALKKLATKAATKS